MMRKTKGENNGETSSEPGEIEINEKDDDKINLQGGEAVNQKANRNADPKSEETIESCEVKDKQIADLSEKFIRLAAEYDNFRRRSQKEKEALLTETIADVAKVWLPVVDNLERAVLISMEYKHEEARKIAEGVNMVLQQVKEAMNTLGITEIEALDNQFDPNAMEAIMHVEDENAGESQVVEVFKKGYKRGDKIIRHSVVKVAN